MYDATDKIPCKDCVAYAQRGQYVLTSARKTEYDLDDYRTWPRPVEGIWMIREIAEKKCKIKTGYDQPRKYDLFKKPIETHFAYQCCNKCARLMDSKPSF